MKKSKYFSFYFYSKGITIPLENPFLLRLAHWQIAPSIRPFQAVALKTPLCCIREIIAAFFPQNERLSRQFLCQFARMQKFKNQKGKASA